MPLQLKKYIFLRVVFKNITNFFVGVLAIYMLVLNALALDHAYDHHQSSVELSLFNPHDKITIVTSDNPKIICELCDLFQNQVIFFWEAGTAILSKKVIDCIESISFESIAFRKYTPKLRGPPVLF